MVSRVQDYKVLVDRRGVSRYVGSINYLPLPYYFNYLNYFTYSIIVLCTSL